jgi:hypothetical protein
MMGIVLFAMGFQPSLLKSIAVLTLTIFDLHIYYIPLQSGLQGDTVNFKSFFCRGTIDK